MDLFGVPMDSFLEWVPAAVGALSSLAVFFVFAKRRVVRIINRVKEVTTQFVEHTNKLDELSSKMSVVLAEVTPNGGSSLKDVVKRIEHRLYDLELTSLTVLDHEQRGVFKTNAGGEIVWVNRAFAHAFDRNRDDLLRFGWISSVDPEQRNDITEEWESAVKLHRQVCIKFFITTTTGRKQELTVNGYPILGNNEVFLGYLGTVNTQS